MSIYVFNRVSKDKLVTLSKSLGEGLWAEIDIKPYEDLSDHLEVPLLALLKLRLLHRATALTYIVSGTSDALQKQDERWDAAQKRYVLKIMTAEADDDPSLQAAATRLRRATTLGDGLGQTKLDYEAEIAFGKKQLTLTSNKERTMDSIPSLAEDLALINAESNMKEIKERTADFDKAIKQTIGDGEVTSRAVRIRLSVAEFVAELNDAHRELEKQISTSKKAEVKARLKALQDELRAAIPHEDAPVSHKASVVSIEESKK
jgi:hypothetical protein